MCFHPSFLSKVVTLEERGGCGTCAAGSGEGFEV